jgi:hypothetical protein
MALVFGTVLWRPYSFTPINRLTGSSGSTVCFAPRGAAVRVLGMLPHFQWNWVLMLAMSHYIGDPDVIPVHWRFRNNLTHWLPEPCLPWFHPLLTGPPHPRNAVTT